MKQLFTIVVALVLCQNVAFAQIPNCDAPTPHPQLAYDALKNLDKSQIPTGVLAEYAYPLEEVEFYDGTATTDTSNYSKFLQVYYQLYLATFNRVNIAHLSDYEKAVHNFHPDREFHHPVGIIDYQFSAIDIDAIDNNLLYVSNEQLYDVSNRTQSPYLTKTTKLATWLFDKGSDCIKSGTHYLHFSPDFVLSNSGFNLNDVQAIEIKLNNVTKFSGSVNGLNNVEIPVVVIGVDKDIIVTMLLTLPSGVKTYQFSICQLPTHEACEGGDVITVTGYPFNGGYGEETYSATALASIYYANEHCASRIITKPIIFVDGFDPGNVQHAYDIYTKYLNKRFDDNGVFSRLGDTLRAKGYDIIIFDPIAAPGEENYKRGGVGFIENNGLALAKFLETFYAEHSSTMTQDFVVVGASMGGLIARFGLSWMEKSNKQHHTRLFISFDSPQAGAQIPLGLQQFVDTFTQVGLLATVDGVRNALHQSNAAKQMLLWHSSTNSEIPQAHPFRSIFLNNLALWGNYPTQCRNIAIVDGNREGILKTIQPSPNPDNIPAINERDKELDLGIKRRIFPNCTELYCYKLHAQVYAQTASIRHKSYDFDMFTNNILLYVASNSFGVRSFVKYAQTTNNTSIDIAPGSRIRKDPLEKAEPWMLNLAHVFIGKVNISTNNIKFSSFVPFISAIDYIFPNNEPYNAYKNFQGIILSKCAGTTPFDTVYAPTQDLDHVDINAYIANAFKDEVFYPKAKSPCSNPLDCPETITLNLLIPHNQLVLKKAQKSIFIEPDFKADASNGTVFKAAIGCNQVLKPIVPLTVTTICPQPFEFDEPRNYKTCDGSNTTFHVFVHNMDMATYAEFSTDINATVWFKANIVDNGYEITLPNDVNSQVFFARSADNRSNVIGGYLAYCN